MEYHHQNAYDEAPRRFSDKPIRIAGVRYLPRWAWSDDYRREFRNAYGFRRDAFNAKRAESERTAAYLAWYRETHGRDWSPTPELKVAA